MQIDAMVLRLRRRGDLESADLGVRLCQYAARSIYRCYALAFVPVFALALASWEISEHLPLIVLWCSKPWLDRTILFVLSRATFGQETRVADLWQAQRQVWWSQLLSTWTLRRLAVRRSFTQPVYQLEGLSGKALRARVKQIRAGKRDAAVRLTVAFAVCESALGFGLFALTLWFTPTNQEIDWMALMMAPSNLDKFLQCLTYCAVIFFLEPFYVAAGFTMYLDRRVELEAWDIEQEFRRGFSK